MLGAGEPATPAGHLPSENEPESQPEGAPGGARWIVGLQALLVGAGPQVLAVGVLPEQVRRNRQPFNVLRSERDRLIDVRQRRVRSSPGLPAERFAATFQPVGFVPVTYA